MINLCLSLAISPVFHCKQYSNLSEFIKPPHDSLSDEGELKPRGIEGYPLKQEIGIVSVTDGQVANFLLHCSKKLKMTHHRVLNPSAIFVCTICYFFSALNMILHFRFTFIRSFMLADAWEHIFTYSTKLLLCIIYGLVFLNFLSLLESWMLLPNLFRPN